MPSRRWFPLVAVSLGIFFFIVASFAEKAPYTSFARDATSAPQSEYYDYIIVGGGTAGCALAATLSASAKVLVLERGGLPYGKPHVSHITNYGKLLLNTSLSSAAQQFVSTDGVFSHRGRILGGSSAINSGFYSRASMRYVAEVGWDPRLVNESYEWVEAKVAFQPRLRQWQTAVRDGLLEAGVTPFRGLRYDHLHGTKIGGTIFDGNGYRHSAADLLEYADPTKITVYLYATVHKILFETSSEARPTANGVLFRDTKGIKHVAYLKSGPTNEVILTAGALGSPQLLMLSGIGPAQHLKDKGITVIMDQPMVGQGMSDNPMNPIIIPSPKPAEVSLLQVVGITNVGVYIEAASRFLEQALTPSLIQRLASLANQTVPEFTGGSDPYLNPIIHDVIIVQKVMGPFSKGYMELQSTDPNDNPRVTFNYFHDPRDLQKCVQGMEVIKRVIESKPVSAFRYPSTSFQSLVELMLSIPNNLRRRHVSASYSMEQFCMDTVMTIWHYHGGCQVDRVVDRDYKVIGVDGLRVIDGSTFYHSPGTNPQATVMMLGRYMGQKILRERVQEQGNGHYSS